MVPVNHSNWGWGRGEGNITGHLDIALRQPSCRVGTDTLHYPLLGGETACNHFKPFVGGGVAVVSLNELAVSCSLSMQLHEYNNFSKFRIWGAASLAANASISLEHFIIKHCNYSVPPEVLIILL